MNNHPFKTPFAVIGMLGTIVSSIVVLAGDSEPNILRGKVYFKMVCNVCHVQMTGKAIPPNSRKIVEWQTYLGADRHDTSGKTNGTVSYYVSQGYRQTIKSANKAADKYLSVPDPELFADIQAFVISGAKDSYTPLSCE